MSDSISLKVGIFGGGGVGKTCITLRYLKGDFTEGYIPTLEDEFSKVIEIEGKTVNLAIVDTAGQDDFAEMRYTYYTKVAGFIFVYDLSNSQTVNDLRSIIKEARDERDDDFIFVIAANKCDLFESGYDSSEFQKLETEFGCKVYATSAKNNTNIEEIFEYIVKLILSKKGPNKNKETKKKNSKSEERNENENENSGGCCKIA